jgi:cytochrome oxidase assembly protein ShyY1
MNWALGINLVSLGFLMGRFSIERTWASFVLIVCFCIGMWFGTMMGRWKLRRLHNERDRLAEQLRNNVNELAQAHARVIRNQPRGIN